MLFDSLNYWVFFAVTIVVLASLTDRASRVGLVIFSLIFYGCWNPWFVLLLGGSILANFGFGLWIEGAAVHRRKAAVTTAIAFNLSLLGFFKYSSLLVGTLGGLFRFQDPAFIAHIVLPVGISFFTFEGIAYAVDIYRRQTPATRNLTNFAVFMSFFPHLIAGPIIRPANFFPQLEKRRSLTSEDTKWGLTQIIKGLLKKIVFADFFAPIANDYFSHTAATGSTIPAGIGVLAFTFQIYFDFAGYTDIARGCARLLGYDFPSNFERPYLSANITEFWRRWHISLSTWLRDYLYIPLGGNRAGAIRTYLNILIVMFLGGLWHGASWNFALWGLYHGFLLLGHRLWSTRIKPRVNFAASAQAWKATKPLAVAFTFLVVVLGWIPFRAPDFSSTLKVIRELNFGGVRPFLTSNPAFIVLVALPLFYCLIDPRRKTEKWVESRASLFTTALLITIALVVIEIFGQFGLKVPFIYFQF
ncbi:MAG TPA: MBOAT family O-acyltransferase [Lacunisphaera sp.]